MWELSKNWWIVSVVLLIPALFLIIGGLISPLESSREIPFLDQPVFGGIIWLGIWAALHIGMFTYLTLQKKKVSYFQQNGLKGSAVILAAEETGTYVNNCPQVEMRLQISVPGRQPYDIVHKRCLSPLSLAQFQSGAAMPVLIDPKNPKKIMFIEL
jgi:hypothetical protein